MKACYNKSSKEYNELLKSFTSEAKVNFIIETYQFQNGLGVDGAYPTVEEAISIAKGVKFNNEFLIKTIKENLKNKIKTLKEQTLVKILGKPLLEKSKYLENKIKIDKQLQRMEMLENELLFTNTIEFAQTFFKEISESFSPEGGYSSATIDSKRRFILNGKQFLKEFSLLRDIEIEEEYSEKFKSLSETFSKEITKLEKTISIEEKKLAIEMLESQATKEELENLNLTGIITGRIKDINWLEAKWGSLATSTNEILAIMDRTYKEFMSKARNKFEEDKNSFLKIAKEYTKQFGDDYSFMMDIGADGKLKTGNIIGKYLHKYQEEKKKLFDDYPSLDEDGNPLTYKRVDKDDNSEQADRIRKHNLALKGIKKIRSNWFSENEELTEEFQAELDKFIKAKWILAEEIKNNEGEVIFIKYRVNEALYEQVEDYYKKDVFIDWKPTIEHLESIIKNNINSDFLLSEEDIMKYQGIDLNEKTIQEFINSLNLKTKDKEFIITNFKENIEPYKENLKEVEKLLKNSDKIKVTYINKKGELSEREITDIVFKSTYLFNGYDSKREENRTFNLKNIISINQVVSKTSIVDKYNQLEKFLETNFDSSVYYKVDKEGNIEDVIEPYNEDGSINSDLSGWRPRTTNYKPKAKWEDSRYEKLMSGSDVKSRYYQAYRKFYEEYGNKVPEYGYKENQLIAMQNSWVEEVIKNPSLKDVMTSVKQSWDKLGISLNNDNDSTGVKVLYNGELVEGLKNKINNLITERKNTTDSQRRDDIDRELAKLYNSVDLDSVNKNLTESLLNYMSMASNFEAKFQMESRTKLMIDVLEDVETFVPDYLFPNKIKNLNENRVKKRLEDWLKMRLHDEMKSDANELHAKLIDNVDKMTSISGLGFNLKSSIGNTISASVNNMIEGAGGMFYSVSDYLKGQKDNGIRIVVNELLNKNNTKTNALMEKLGLFEKFNPVNPNDVTESINWKRKMTSDVAFILSNASEYYVQSSVAVTMLQTHRIVDGKILGKVDWKGDIKEFEKYPTVWDSIEYKDGELNYKEVLKNVSEREIFLLSQRIIGLNQKIHGRYTQDEAAAITQEALGRMLSVFRRWIPAAVEERFTKKHYDFRLRTDIEGRYITVIRLTKALFSKAKRDELKWNTLTPLEKRNMKAALFELSAIIVTGILIRLLSKAASDMDDEDEYYMRKLTNFTAYMSNRTFSELTTFYSPILFATYGEAPLTNFVAEIYDFNKTVFMYPFQTDKERHFSRGSNKGRLKIEKEFGDVIPLWKDLSFYNSLSYNNDYYFAIK